MHVILKTCFHTQIALIRVEAKVDYLVPDLVDYSKSTPKYSNATPIDADFTIRMTGGKGLKKPWSYRLDQSDQLTAAPFVMM